MGGNQVMTRRSVLLGTGAALALPAALFQLNFVEKRRMSFTPKFVDLVRNYTTTVGTGDFLLGPAVNGFASFANALQAGDQFYYSAIGIDHPTEREVGRGTLQANGTISRSPISGAPTAFTTGTKTIALIAAAEWYNQMQAGAGGAGASQAATKAALAAAATAAPVMLTQVGSEGLFLFDGSDLSAEVAADVEQGVHVAPQSDPTGASGAWVRADQDAVNAFWFMTPAEVADVRAFTYTQNVTAALKAASAYVERSGGGTLLLPRGGYLVGLQTFHGTTLDGVTTIAYGPSEVITIRNCTKAVKVSGYGAVIKAAPGLKYGSFDPATGNRYDPPSLPFIDASYYAYPYRAMVNLEGNASVTVEGLELDGNNTLLALGGYWGDSQWQVEGHGIWCKGNGSALIQDCYIHHQPCDGMTLSGSGITEASAPPVTTIRNLRSRYNGRIAVSITGGKNISMTGCDLSRTGQALNTVSNEMVRSGPGAGMDIEPEGSVVRDVTVTSTTVIGNWLKGIAGTSGNSRRVSFNRCKIETLFLSRPEYAFTDCTFIGFVNVGLASVDQYTSLPTTAADGQVFRRCTFTYDASLTESGTLINATQSSMDELLWGRLEGCTFDTGSVNLPSFNIPGLSESSPVFVNCRWRSTSSAPVAIHGRFQGYNYIDHGGAPLLDIGTKSRIESGDVVLNGVNQAAAIRPPDGDYGDVAFSAGGTVATVESVTVPASGYFPVSAPAGTDLYLDLNAQSGRAKAIEFKTGGIMRWFLGVDNTGEGGSNSGAPFALVRYDDYGSFAGYVMSANRATGNVTFSGAVSAGGLLSTSPASGIGYASGAGGAVTQATSKSTGVTIDKTSGQITTHAASIAAGAVASFVVSNAGVAATDTIKLDLASGNATTASYRYWVEGITNGAFTIVIENRSGGALSEALLFNFAVVKAVNA